MTLGKTGKEGGERSDGDAGGEARKDNDRNGTNLGSYWVCNVREEREGRVEQRGVDHAGGGRR